MMHLQTLTTREPGAWMCVLDACVPYDFYQLPEYHALAEEAGEGTAQLFTYTEGDYVLAFPMLLRPVADDLLTETVGPAWQDATSVYGYAGPVCSHRQVHDTFVHNFQAALQRQLRDLRVVSVFSRLHPLFPQRSLLAGLGDFAVSKTVSIDLTLPEAVQWSQMRRSHRETVNRLRQLGLTCVRDQEGAYLEDFRRVYYQTMHRVNAAKQYYFPPTYFERLQEALGSRLHLFVCLREGAVVCGGLFVTCHGILQYHLGGTSNEVLRLAPMKLLVNEVRLWATGQGLRVFHLGGGVTAHPDDSLLFFKRGFSDRAHEFATWRWVVYPEVYHHLCAEKARQDQRHQCHAANPHFFPAYRCPTVPRALATADAATAGPLAETTQGGSE
jgi:hypothetical protein